MVERSGLNRLLILPTRRLRDHHRREPGHRGKGCAMLSSEPGKATTIVIPQQLGLAPMGLHKTRPVVSQLRIREGLKGSYRPLLSYWLLITAGRVGHHCLQFNTHR